MSSFCVCVWLPYLYPVNFRPISSLLSTSVQLSLHRYKFQKNCINNRELIVESMNSLKKFYSYVSQYLCLSDQLSFQTFVWFVLNHIAKSIRYSQRYRNTIIIHVYIQRICDYYLYVYHIENLRSLEEEQQKFSYFLAM